MAVNLPSAIKKSTLRYDITLSLGAQSKQPLLDLEQFINSSSKISERDVDLLYLPDDDFLTARELVRRANLPDFEPLKWVSFSQTDQLLSNDKVKIDDKKLLARTVGLRDLLAKAIEIYAPQAGSFLKIFFIGDYRPVVEMASIIVNSQLQGGNYDLDWNAFTPDPYLDYSNDKIETPISRTNQFYDDFIGQKFYCGSDGTGKLTQENLLWMVSNPQIRAELPSTENREIDPNFCIGLLDRQDYMSYDILKRDTVKCYNLLISLIASTQTGGIGILEIPTPNYSAMNGIFALFNSFFSRLHIIKLKQDAIDNDTVYLLGSSFNKNPETNAIIYPIDRIEFYVQYLSQPGIMYPVLNFMSNKIRSFHIELNSVMEKPLENHIKKLLEAWPSRNI
jgi:hypothetical protein